MSPQIRKAYESLVPADQLIVDAVIITMAKKDREIRDLVTEVHKFLNGDNDAEQVES